jgi:pimeloyl-ACP methyl ester carboxylesterase
MHILKFISVFWGLLFLFSSFDGPKFEIKKVKIGDVELAYYTRGKGEPLVLIMGFRGTMGMWDPTFLTMLEQQYTLILFDHRGVGFSTDTSEDRTTITQMADDTAHLIKALGYSKAHILGWSMGSRIAMDLTINHPEIAESLILCSPNPGGTHQVKRLSDAYKKFITFNKLDEKTGLSIIFPDTETGNLAAANYISRLKKAVLEKDVPYDFMISEETIRRQVHALQLWDHNETLFGQLKKINVPTLVAGGLKDVLDNPENVKIIANQIPDAWLAYFPHAGHYFISQNHEQFAELVKIFLTSTTGK